MRRLQERDGISFSEQMRRALRPWLESKDVLKKAERRRAGTANAPEHQSGSDNLPTRLCFLIFHR
jgi:hypothetical protein